jgi:hypothetical protein
LFKFRKRKYSESDLFTRTIITISNYLHRYKEVKIEQTTPYRVTGIKTAIYIRGGFFYFFLGGGGAYGCNRNNKTGAWEPNRPFQYIKNYQFENAVKKWNEMTQFYFIFFFIFSCQKLILSFELIKFATTTPSNHLILNIEEKRGKRKLNYYNLTMTIGKIANKEIREREITSETCLSSSLNTIDSEAPSWFKKSANGIYNII